MNPDVTNESLKACYRVVDHKLKELMLSPRARVKISGEYICYVQCYKSLKTENLEEKSAKICYFKSFCNWIST